MKAIRPTMFDRMQSAASFVFTGTLVMVLSKMYEYHERPSGGMFAFVMIRLRVWFIVFVPILAVLGATIGASRYVERRARRK